MAKRIILWLAVLLLVIIGGTGVYAYNMYTSLNKTLESVHEPVVRDFSKRRPKQVEVKRQEPLSILLLGVDERAKDKGRSDSLLLVTVNPNRSSTKVLSIPRDSYAEIVGRKGKDKINHAYAYGGVQMAMDTVEQFLDVPIDYYVQVNMEGFRDIVNAVGGVTVDNPFAFTFEGASFTKGLLHLSGKQALSYARMRKEDPNGDFGRQQRQRQVIQAVIKRGASFSSLTHYGDILQAIQKNVKTNVPPGEIYTIQQHYKGASQNIEQLQIQGEGKLTDSGWYYFVSDASRQAISKALREHLELES
ncbi:LytR family transcriptional regulator [Bacillus sp. 165]|uniref:polyisoprenyl-teichoic acid--peptidoglycan teichoic acid transferase TagU n=1 Tax=Bacillus sp. 165 TaxID=1529117 RepID=UPI001ADB4243|nr:LytR family transcriptional regulator [Bacillus sp. 165]MBO9129990.1 LytR family transcriptional regulator [Bacillus sp. 165]